MSKNNVPYEAINDIYHSETVYEMQVKLDLYNINLNNDVDVVLMLIDITTYHHAFWPHTAKRFTSFKQILRKQKDLPKNPQFEWMVNRVKAEIDEYEHDVFRANTLGGKQEIKNLIQVVKILEHLKMKYMNEQT